MVRIGGYGYAYGGVCFTRDMDMNMDKEALFLLPSETNTQGLSTAKRRTRGQISKARGLFFMLRLVFYAPPC